MQITRIILENFRQFQGKHEINLTPGFNLIQGPNGSGKSNILYAINFGLYKGTSKGMVASEDLISFGEDYMSITIEFERNGKKFRIYRQIDRNKKEDYKYEECDKSGNYVPILTAKSSKTSVKERVEHDTNIRQMVFDSIAFAQQKDYYKIVQGDKDFMDNALHVLPLTFLKGTVHDQIPKKSDLVKNQALYSQNEESITQNQKTKDGQSQLKGEMERSLDQLQTDKTKLVEDNKSYGELQKKVKGLGGDIDKLIDYYNKIDHNNKDIRKKAQEKEEFNLRNGDLAFLEGERDSTQDAIKSLSSQIEDFSAEIRRKSEMSGQITAELREKEKVINNLKGLEGTPQCPLCRQEVTPEHLNEEIDKLSREMKTISSEKKRHDADLQTSQKALQDLNNQKTALDAPLDDLKQKINEVKGIDKLITEKQNEVNKAQENYSALLETFTRPFNKILSTYNELFNDSLQITKTPSISFIDNSHQKMANLIKQRQVEYQGNLSDLDKRIDSLKKQLDTINQAIAIADRAILEAKQKIKNLKFEILLEGKMSLLDEVLGNLIQEFREKKVEQLNQYTLEWYNRLISAPLFRDIRIDKENYHVDVLPLPNVVEKDDYKDINKYASGGHETFIAIAERLALLEIFGTNFGMFDEITDNADRDNASNMILELAHSGEYLDQVIAVTHFEVGREIAGNIVHISPILDKEGNQTGWSEIES